MTNFIEGAYYEYHYKGDSKTTIEGVAVARKHQGDFRLIDIYFGVNITSPDPFTDHVLTSDEMETAELILDPSDGWSVTRNNPVGLYNKRDYKIITSQGRKHTWLRDGAEPDKGVQIQASKDRVAAIKREIDSSIRMIEMEVAIQARLIAESSK